MVLLIIYTYLAPWNYPFLAILLISLALLLLVKYLIIKYKHTGTPKRKSIEVAIYFFIAGLFLGLFWMWRVYLPHAIFYSDSVAKIKYIGYEDNSELFFKGEINEEKKIKEILAFFQKGYITTGCFVPVLSPMKANIIEFLDGNSKLLNRFYYNKYNGLRPDPLKASIITAQDYYSLVKLGLYEYLLEHSTPISGEEYQKERWGVPAPDLSRPKPDSGNGKDKK